MRGALIFFWGKDSWTKDFNHPILIPHLRSLMKDPKFLPAMITSRNPNYVGCNVVMFSSWWFQPTQLKNIRQIGNLPQFLGWKYVFLKPPPSFNQFFWLEKTIPWFCPNNSSKQSRRVTKKNAQNGNSGLKEPFVRFIWEKTSHSCCNGSLSSGFSSF